MAEPHPELPLDLTQPMNQQSRFSCFDVTHKGQTVTVSAWQSRDAKVVAIRILNPGLVQGWTEKEVSKLVGIMEFKVVPRPELDEEHATKRGEVIL